MKRVEHIEARGWRVPQEETLDGASRGAHRQSELITATCSRAGDAASTQPGMPPQWPAPGFRYDSHAAAGACEVMAHVQVFASCECRTEGRIPHWQGSLWGLLDRPPTPG
jgi:hypothetical protein